MTTAKKAVQKSNAQKSADSDAIALLTADHREAKKLFTSYDKLVEGGGSNADKQRLAQQICVMLTVHATVEEEIFYPAAREGIDEPDLVDEAAVEHTTATDLIMQIEDSSPEDQLYDAKVQVLGEYVDHHIKEEEDEMFPQAKKAGLDLDALGEQILARKEELKLDPVEV